MRCPICKRDVAPGEPYMPFCSDRCRIIDLGNWASGKYVISTPVTDETENEESENQQGDK
jgi:uncharacterized protein